MKQITINNWSDLDRALKNDYKAICTEMIDELMQGIIAWPMLRPEYQNLETLHRIINTDYNSKPKENSLFNLLEKKIFDWCREKYKISNRPNSIKSNTKLAYEYIAEKLENSRKYKAFLTARAKLCYDALKS